MKSYTLLPNPFTEAPATLLELLHAVTPMPAVCWYIPSTPLNGKATELFVRADFVQLISHDCDLDFLSAGIVDFKTSTGGWFVFECEPVHALEHYRAYEMRVLGYKTPHKTFGCKHFDMYSDMDETFYVPVFSGLYEMQIQCAM